MHPAAAAAPLANQHLTRGPMAARCTRRGGYAPPALYAGSPPRLRRS